MLSFLPVNHKSSYSLLISSRTLVYCFSMRSAEKKLTFPSHAHRLAKRLKLPSWLKCILTTTAKLYHARKKSNIIQRAALNKGTIIPFYSLLISSRTLVYCFSMRSAEKKLTFPSHAHRLAKRLKLPSWLKCIPTTTAKLYHARKKSNSTQRAAL